MSFITNTLLEKRVHPATPTQWLIDYFSGNESKSGVKVNEESALYCTAVYACIRLLSSTQASLPLILYKRLDRGKERARDHPSYKLMHDQANPEMPAYIFRETLMAHMFIYGNAYAQKVKNASGKIVQLWPLRPDKMIIERDENTKELIYNYDGVSPRKIFKKSEILHIPGLGFDGIQGYSSIKLLNEAIGLSLATEQFGAMFFGEGTHPSGVVTLPPDKNLGKDPDSPFIKSLKTGFAGLGKSHKLMVLEEGMKLDLVGVEPEKAQALQTRQHQVTEIARFYGVQPHMIGDLTRSTNNNIEEQGLEFVIYTLRPGLVRWEQFLNMQLLTEQEHGGYFFEHLIDGLLRGDTESRAQFYKDGIGNGWFSPNDVRDMENKNPIDGGDRYFVPMNMVPLDKVDDVLDKQQVQKNPQNEPKEPDKKPKKDKKSLQTAYKRLFFDALNRINKRETADFERIERKKSLIDSIDDYYQEFPDFMEKNLLPIYLSYFEAQNDGLSAENEQKAHYLCRNYIEIHVKTVKSNVKKGQKYKISDMIDLILKGVDSDE